MTHCVWGVCQSYTCRVLRHEPDDGDDEPEDGPEDGEGNGEALADNVDQYQCIFGIFRPEHQAETEE